MHVGWESSKNYSLVLVRFINLLSFEMFYIKGESNGIVFFFFFFLLLDNLLSNRIIQPPSALPPTQMF
jgi:hypothetical protein